MLRALATESALFSLDEPRASTADLAEGSEEEIELGPEDSRVGDEEEELSKWKTILADNLGARLEQRASTCQGRTQDNEVEPARKYWDASTGEELPASLVEAARHEEVSFMQSVPVWKVVPLSQCRQRTGKGPIKGKWVDVNKGDSEQPDIRSRYVGMEVAYQRDDAFHSSMPPLEALRLLISRTAAGRCNGVGGRKIRVIDAKKAHLHAYATRELHVELPAECRVPGHCGLLQRCLYGTRDAPLQWERYMAAQLEKLGFVRGQASPCCFHHRHRDLLCVVHGDDFILSGCQEDLDWVSKAMEGCFLCKVVGTLGGDAKDSKELRVLNRVLQWRPWGIAYQADPRHTELLSRDVLIPEVVEIAGGVGGSRTPGLKQKVANGGPKDLGGAEAEEEEDLPEWLALQYRSWAARALYLSLDRPDVGFSAKELCRGLTCPRRSDVRALVRLVRYLDAEKYLIYRYAWEEEGEERRLKVYSDTDFAGCAQTRRSTNGGVVMLGGHLIKHYSTTQRAVTLSSAEAELGGIVKSAAEAMGIRSLASDLGLKVSRPNIFADASAAIGICRRAGIGRVRHLAVAQLWAQEQLRQGTIGLFKVKGESNIADLFTKYLAGPTLSKLLGLLPVEVITDRARSAPLISG